MKYKDTSGQRDLLGILADFTHIHIKKPPSVDGKRVYYSLLPLGTSVPGGGTALITATTGPVFIWGIEKPPICPVSRFPPARIFRGSGISLFMAISGAPTTAGTTAGMYG